MEELEVEVIDRKGIAMDLDAEFDKIYGNENPARENTSPRSDLDAEFDKMYGDTQPAKPAPTWESGDGNPATLPDGETNQWGGNLRNEGRKPLIRRDKTGKVNGYSTTTSMLVRDEDGKIAVIPTVVGGQELSPEDAVKHYAETGEHWGKADDEEGAKKIARTVHEEHQKSYQKGWNDYIHDHWDDMGDEIRNDPGVRGEHSKRRREARVKEAGVDKAAQMASKKKEQVLIGQSVVGPVYGEKEIQPATVQVAPDLFLTGDVLDDSEGRTVKPGQFVTLSRKDGTSQLLSFEGASKDGKPVFKEVKGVATAGADLAGEINIDEDDYNRMFDAGNAKVDRPFWEQVRHDALANTGDAYRYTDDAYGTFNAFYDYLMPFLGGSAKKEHEERTRILSDIREGRLDGYDGDTDAAKLRDAARKAKLEPWNPLESLHPGESDEDFAQRIRQEAEDELKLGAAAKGRAEQARQQTEATVGDKVLKGGVESGAFWLQFAIPGSIMFKGLSSMGLGAKAVRALTTLGSAIPATVAEADKRYSENITPEYGWKQTSLDGEPEFGMVAAPDAPGEAAYKAIGGAALDTGVEVGLESATMGLLRLAGKPTGWLLGKATPGAVKEWGAKKFNRFMASEMGQALRQINRAYQDFTLTTGVNNPLWEQGEENVQALEKVLNLDGKTSEYKGLQKEWNDFYDRQFNADTQWDIFYGLIAQLGLGAAKSTAEGVSRHISEADVRRDVRMALARSGISEATLKTLTPEQQKKLDGMWRQYSADPDALKENVKDLGISMRLAVDELTAREGLKMRQSLEQRGIAPERFTIQTGADGKPAFQKMTRFTPDGKKAPMNAMTDAAHGVTIVDQGDGNFYVMNDFRGLDAIPASSFEDAQRKADAEVVRNQSMDADNEQKAQYLMGLVQRQYAGRNVVSIPSESALRWQVAQAVRDGRSLYGITRADQLFREDGSLRQPGAGGFHTPDGHIVVILDNVPSPAEMERVLAHEATGHEGVESATGRGAKTVEFIQNAQAEEFSRFVEGERQRAIQRRVTKGMDEATATAQVDAAMATDDYKRESMARYAQGRLHAPTWYERRKHETNERRRAAGENVPTDQADLEVMLAEQEAQGREGDNELETLNADSGVRYEEGAADETGNGAAEAPAQPEQGEERGQEASRPEAGAEPGAQAPDAGVVEGGEAQMDADLGVAPANGSVREDSSSRPDLTLESHTAEQLTEEKRKRREKAEIKKRQEAPLKGSGAVNVQPEMDLGQTGQQDLFSPTAENEETPPAAKEKAAERPAEYLAWLEKYKMKDTDRHFAEWQRKQSGRVDAKDNPVDAPKKTAATTFPKAAKPPKEEAPKANETMAAKNVDVSAFVKAQREAEADDDYEGHRGLADLIESLPLEKAQKLVSLWNESNRLDDEADKLIDEHGRLTRFNQTKFDSAENERKHADLRARARDLQNEAHNMLLREAEANGWEQGDDAETGGVRWVKRPARKPATNAPASAPKKTGATMPPKASKPAEVEKSATGGVPKSSAPTTARTSAKPAFKRGDRVFIKGAKDGQRVTFLKANADGTADVQVRTPGANRYAPEKVETRTVPMGDVSSTGMKDTLTGEERNEYRRGMAEQTREAMRSDPALRRIDAAYRAAKTDAERAALKAQFAERVRALQGGVDFDTPGIFTGSAADYEKPSLHHVGTGEGSQVYGWGLYGSNVRGVAEGYARQGRNLNVAAGDAEYKLDGKSLDRKNDVIDSALTYLASERMNTQKAIEEVNRAIDGFKKQLEDTNERLKWDKNNFRLQMDAESLPRRISHLNEVKGFIERDGGKIRQVLPSENVYEQTFFTDRAPGDESHLLKWYEPVSEEQMKWIRSHFNENQEELILDWMRSYYQGREGSGPFALDRSAAEQKARREWEKALAFNNRSGEAATGKDVYINLSEILGPQAASEFLARAGIDGVKYPVDSYGGKGVKDGDEAGWNYVSFRDDNIRVDHKWTDGVLQFDTPELSADYSSVPERLDHSLWWISTHDEQMRNDIAALRKVAKRNIKAGADDTPSEAEARDLKRRINEDNAKAREQKRLAEEDPLNVDYYKKRETYYREDAKELRDQLKELERNGIGEDREEIDWYTNGDLLEILDSIESGEASSSMYFDPYAIGRGETGPFAEALKNLAEFGIFKGKDLERFNRVAQKINDAYKRIEADIEDPRGPFGESLVSFDTPELSPITPAEDAGYMDAVRRGDMETARRMVREAAARAVPIVNISPTRMVDPMWIITPNAIQDQSKFEWIAEDMKRNGWRGRPILAWNEDGDLFRAFTGSHRTFAAKEAEIDVPVYELSQEQLDSFSSFLDDVGTWDINDWINNLDDSDKATWLERAVEEGGLEELREAAELMREEVDSEESSWNGHYLDPVTYDDAGNVIPLSQRFNPQNDDIRFDTPELTPAEAEYAASEDKTPTEKVMREVYGMTNDEIATALKAAGMEPPAYVRKTDADMWRQVETLLSNSTYMAKLSRAVAKFPRPTRDYENVALNVLFRQRQAAVNDLERRRAELAATPEDDMNKAPELRDELRQVSAKLAQAKAQMGEAGKAAMMGASEQSRALRSNRTLIGAHDYSYAGIAGRIAQALGGVEKITPEMNARIRDLAKLFEGLDAEGLRLATERLIPLSKKIIDQTKNGLKVRKATERKVGDVARKVAQNYQDALTQIEVGAVETGGTLVGLSDQQYPSWGKWLRQIGEYHCFLNPEITEEEVIDAIVRDISPFMTDGHGNVLVDANQVRDALTGFGHNYKQSRYDAQRLMNSLRNISRSKRQIDWMDETNTMPPATGPIRDEPTQDEREWAKRVRDRKAEVPDAGRDERRLKGVLDSIKTRTRNRIEDLKRAIETRERIPATQRKVVEDIELREMRKEKDELQKQYDELFGTTREMTDAQRIALTEKLLAKELERAMEDFARAQAGDFSKRPQRPGITSATIEAQRDSIRQVRESIRELKKAKYEFGMTPEEIEALNARKIANREKAVARLAERVATGDIRTGKPQPPMTKDQQKQYDELGEQMKRGRQKLAELRLEAENATVPTFVRRGVNFLRFVTTAQRAFRATMDFSAVLRQAARMTLGHPVKAARSFGKAWTAMRSEASLLDVNTEIMSDPTVQEAVKKFGLHLREVDATSDRDVEMFHGIERNKVKIFGKEYAITDIPFFGEFMLKSERHYLTYLNAMSADLYTSIVNGIPGGATAWQKKMIADMINIWNGSAALSKERRQALQKAWVNDIFWAPQLAISRVQSAVGYDIWHPLVAKGIKNADGSFDKVSGDERKTAAKIGLREHLKSTVAMLVLGAMLKWMFSDDDDKYDFSQADWFEKMMMLVSPKIGNTTIDLTGGESTFNKLVHQLATRSKRTGSGRLQKFGDFNGPSTWGVIGRYLQGKLSPSASTIAALWEGKDYVGEEYGAGKMVQEMLVPLTFEDVKDQIEQNGVGKSLVTVPLSILGAGGSTYDRKPYENAVNRFLEAEKEYSDYAKDESLGESDRKAILDELKASNPLLADGVRQRLIVHRKDGNAGLIPNAQRAERQLKKLQSNPTASKSALDDAELRYRKTREDVMKYIRENRRKKSPASSEKP